MQDESVMAYYDKPNNALTYYAEDVFYFPVYCYQLFYDFTSLTTINGLNLVDTSRVNDMYRMFRFCESLTSLDLSNWDTTNVTNMEDMFYSCEALTSFTVGNNFTMDNVTSYSSYLWTTGYNVPNYDRGYVYSSDGTWYSRSSKLPNGANTYYTYNPAA